MTHRGPRDDGDILGMSAPRAKKPRDESDILGACAAQAQTPGATPEAAPEDEDALIDEQAPARDGIFEGLDTTRMTEEQLEEIVQLMCMSINLPAVKQIMASAGCPRLPKTSVVPKMVSEACKIYIAQLVELSVDGRVDFLAGDSMLAKKYSL